MSPPAVPRRVGAVEATVADSEDSEDKDYEDFPEDDDEVEADDAADIVEDDDDDDDGERKDKASFRKTRRRPKPMVDDSDDHNFFSRLQQTESKQRHKRGSTKITRTPLAAEMQNVQEEEEEMTWSCDVCTFVNPSDFKKCDMCSTRKARKSAAAAAVNPAPTVKPEPREVEEEVAPIEHEGESDEEVKGEEQDVCLDGGYRIPGAIFDKLFPYQRTAIKWLWELHGQQTGGIIADEMGLGKTVQIAAYFAGLHYTSSGTTTLGPSLVICPATVMVQWMREFHTWYPPLRVMMMHESGGYTCSREELVDKVQHVGGVLITTYESFRLNQHLLVDREWGYVVLDEGHKIRNPDASITLCVKQLLTVHRIILTGCPIQNSLRELWSLFDFVFPGKLGTLPVFEEEFCWPILQGGYTSASNVQVQLAYKCALVLRDLINPYVLRRLKKDVMPSLPKKTEQILFCHLTDLQRKKYQEYLGSRDVKDCIEGDTSLFRAITMLRKLCNHPDLLSLLPVQGKTKRVVPSDMTDFGAVERSGKMLVLQQVLRLWHTQGKRALVFAQTKQMLDILEGLVRQEGFAYLRVDGSTSIKQRLPLIDQFNTDASIFVMLLTTKAGGLGVNLTGASRVILYDPDWNPSTDAQARERAYRIGQKLDVTVYRLITKGTIEEKVYHRQVFKQFMTNKVLQDPRQKRFFSRSDISDLFMLGSKNGATETEDIFEGVDGQVFAPSDEEEEKEREPTPRSKKKRKVKQEGGIESGGSSNSSSTGKDEVEEVDVGAGSRGGKRKRKSTNSSSSSSSSSSTEVVDGEAVGGGETPKSKKDQRDGSEDGEILSVLFATAGIQSAFSHDRILQANQSETLLVEQAAQAIADRAVSALRLSRAAMSGGGIGVPTWTGRSGSAGLAPPRRFGGASRLAEPPSSSNSNSNSNDSSNSGRSSSSSSSSSGPVGSGSGTTSSGRHFDSSVSGFARPPGANAPSSEELLADAARKRDGSSNANFERMFADLVRWLRNKEVGASSSSILAVFGPRLKGDEAQHVFKKLLQRAALFSKRTGRWRVRPEHL
jgi:DNA excision repair protein ERCC-6